MTDWRRFLLLSFYLFFLGVISSPVAAAEASDKNRRALDGLLDELEKKIEDADKRMVAHPKFLDEIQTLADKYKGRLRAAYLSDDFSDGGYNRKGYSDSGKRSGGVSWNVPGEQMKT